MKYERIEIKSEADLPKERRYYDTNKGNMIFEPVIEESFTYWLLNVKWYFLPINEDEYINDDSWLKEELINFLEEKDFDIKYSHPDSFEEIIDDYLKNRKV